MSDTVESLSTQLATLRDLRAKGTRKVEYQSGSVEYRSDAELAAAIGDLERRLAAQQTTGPLRVIYLTSSKGTR